LAVLLSIWFTLFYLSFEKTPEKNTDDNNITKEQINFSETAEEITEEKEEEDDEVKYCY
jgi:hypothetical protein